MSDSRKGDGGSKRTADGRGDEGGDGGRSEIDVIPQEWSEEALEWDHSADFGVPDSTSKLTTESGGTGKVTRSSELSSGNSKKLKHGGKRVYFNSTPATTHSSVPLDSLIYSPVVGPGQSSGSSTGLESRYHPSLSSRLSGGGGTGDSKRSSFSYVPDWQTNGITRSEIEYQNRKKNGSSTTSASSSGYLLVSKVKVDIKLDHSKEVPPHPPEPEGVSKVSTDDNVKDDSTISSLELGRMINKALATSTSSSSTASSSESPPSKETASIVSGPSSTCVLVDDFVRALGRHPNEHEAKKKMEFDVLKSHRDYHVKKLYEQISKLKQLNWNLLVPHHKPAKRIAETSEDIPDSRTPRQEKRHHEQPLAIDKPKKKRSESDTRTRGSESNPLEQQIESILKRYNLQSRPGRTQQDPSSIRRSSIGFFVPLTYNPRDFVQDEVPEEDLIRINVTKAIQQCLQERNPETYKSILDRDNFFLSKKHLRQLQNESILKGVLDREMSLQEMQHFIREWYRYRDEHEKRRMITYLEMYNEAQKYLMQNKEKNEQAKHRISAKERHERTQRLRMAEIREKTREMKEREKRRAMREKQKNFSTNLRNFQKRGNVNVPEQLNLVPSLSRF